MNFQQLIGYSFKALASLLAIVNPPIAIPFFVSLSGRLTREERTKQAFRVALYVAIILLCVLGFGSLILRVFGISAGPGSMAVVIGFSTLIQQEHSILEQFLQYTITVVTILIVAGTVWIVLRSSSLIAQKLGDHGLTALSRVMGFLMVCIGIQFIPSGILELVKSLTR